MKSTSGAHFIALDHVRALAAFCVFVWHFTHASSGYPVSFDYVPAIFPFAILDEGHTGVALFMTLSGYLFAKLLNGKTIDYKAFLWNRVLRLFPLLAVIIFVVGINKYIAGENLYLYWKAIAKGAAYPSLPNGGWSITVESHYYLILPLLLWMFSRSKLLPLSVVAIGILVRYGIYETSGQVQTYAYWTILGRIDQFTLGMLMYQFGNYLAGRHAIAAVTLLTFTTFYWLFDLLGGFWQFPSYPSPSPIWIVLPTIEGLAYGVFIAWYDNSFAHKNTGISKFIGRIGEYSYSIYLFHFFFVFHAARFINERIMNISNFYLACLWGLMFFVLMLPVGYLSFKFIESPFLRLRRRYIISPVVPVQNTRLVSDHFRSTDVSQ